MKPSLCLHVGYLLVVGMTEITETNKFSPLSAEILTMFYLGETCGSQICVREYPMTGSQMTVFTSYNQIHCWVDQNKMKNAISFSISVLSLIVFAIAFFLPTSGENRAAIAILAMVALIGNQCVAILPHTTIWEHINGWLKSSPDSDDAFRAAIGSIGMSAEWLLLYQIKETMPEAWPWISLADVFCQAFCLMVILFWAIPAGIESHRAKVAAQKNKEYELLVKPLEDHKQILKDLDSINRELRLSYYIFEEKMSKI